ncbi:hypothetical protein GWK48_09890 [Metallosphaera tengchongensis]|uniref:SCP domain-containing protein n=1 Tax=Metallosphaera tengchongensis TaxID=1532350 RepID=A0A6N0NXQ4_9CREN|nr:CAP domain-containing protein [Metallosphaera tengchongensis]QKR00653.1 hypothetical protein GWK48_09890 [Metallosphaera tengchongensis]
MSLVRTLVDYINKIRSDHGIQPVKYANSGASNFRANYMLKENIFSHYDKEGVNPVYYFTRAGNYFGMEEAIGYTFSIFPRFKDGVSVVNVSKDLIHQMVYDDQESNWGHRDTLLNPCANYSDVSVAWDSRRVFLVITMISAWVNWGVNPSIRDSVFYAKGRVRVMSPESVIIFQDEPNPSYVSRRYYDLGRPIEGVLPPGLFFRDLRTIRPYTWKMGEEMELKFPLQLTGGVYTVVVNARDSRRVKWKPLSGRDPELCSILTFSFKVPQK